MIDIRKTQLMLDAGAGNPVEPYEVATQYREAPKLLGVLELLNANMLGNLIPVTGVSGMVNFRDDNLTGELLTAAGSRVGLPRSFEVPESFNVFGFWAAGTHNYWGNWKDYDGYKLYTPTDELYRKIVRIRHMQLSSNKTLNDLELALSIWMDGAPDDYKIMHTHGKSWTVFKAKLVGELSSMLKVFDSVAPSANHGSVELDSNFIFGFKDNVKDANDLYIRGFEALTGNAQKFRTEVPPNELTTEAGDNLILNQNNANVVKTIWLD